MALYIHIYVYTHTRTHTHTHTQTLIVDHLNRTAHYQSTQFLCIFVIL